jgi:predicted acylesterase/phospholipase RssA
VRINDVLSALYTDTRLPSPFRTAPLIGRVASWRRRSLAILLLCVICSFSLQGCAGVAVNGPRSSADGQPPVNLPLTIRTLGTNLEFSKVPSAAVAERLHAMHAGETLNILALSGGGTDGAFGAGAVAGLTRSGGRPEFAVVTGVSAGALVAPYAFLGPTWDARLLAAFSGTAGDNLLRSRGLGALFGSSLYSGAPLRHLVDAYVSDTMIRAIGGEVDKGRLLLVATTDVATGEPILWDLGAIAKNGGSSARILFRDILVASASVPGVFPPIIIHVEENGESHDEAHVDGAATVPFFVPSAFMQPRSGVLDGTDHTAVFVIIDGPLGEGEAARTTRLTAHAILSRSIRAGLNHMLLTTLELTAVTAELDHANLWYSAVPSAYPLLNSFDFRAESRRPLLRYAYECAQTGRLWTAFHRSDNDGNTSQGIAETKTLPCPADDPFIAYVATR